MILALLLLGCPKRVELEEPVERDDRVAPEEAEPLLTAALTADDGSVRALAAESLVRQPFAGDGFALASGLAFSADERVRLAVIRALGTRVAEPGAATRLAVVLEGQTRADWRIRGEAALALAASEDPAHRATIARLAAEAPLSGSTLGVIAAGVATAAPGAQARMRELMLTALLPLEPAALYALRDPSLPWAAALERAEPELLPVLACAMLTAGAPGAGSAARAAVTAPGELAEDAVEVMRDCPAPTATAYLRGPAGRVARVARGQGSWRVAVRALDGELAPDAVIALASRPEPEAHEALAVFAAQGTDAGREWVAMALRTRALETDRPLLESLRSDASLTTRVAAAIALRRLGPAR